jgi:hypothetical protein
LAESRVLAPAEPATPDNEIMGADSFSSAELWPFPEKRGFYFNTASLSALEGRSRTTVLALILIASPVCGLRPMRALR